MNSIAFRRFLVFSGIILFALGCFFAEYTKYHPMWGRTNVLVITVDTLRSDHLGAYGYDKIKTPAIDGLAKNGTLFKTAISQAPLTLPSHVSMFTSTYPPYNQIRDNGNNKLDESAHTLAEIFNDRGYDTAAFVSTFVLNARFGLDQGFQIYNDVREVQDPNLVIRHMDGERTADKTTDQVIGWLRSKGPKPFFLWVHYYDPHTTYNPPQPFREQYPDNPYDGEIAFTDSQIARLLNELRRLELTDKTLIVFASDHGESFGEHGENGHAVFVYDTTQKVPLIFSHPDLVPHKKVLEDQVRLVDVAPTILDLIKIRRPKTFQGISLKNLLKGKPLPEALVAYAESLYANKHYKWSSLLAYRTQEWKYIHSTRPELFNIKEDPGELENLATTRSDIAQMMDEELKSFLLRIQPETDKDTSIETDEVIKQTLMSLGYLQGSEESDTNEPVPIEMIAVMEAINLAVRQVNQGMFDEAIQGLKDVLKKDPKNVEVYMHLGQIYRELKQYDDAIVYFKKALSFNPNQAKVHDGLGNVYKTMGKVEQAYQEFLRADELEPDSPSTLNNLGWYFQQKMQVDKAIDLYNQALAIDDKVATAYANRAICYRIKGDISRAMEDLRRAIELDPELAFAYAELGACLAIRGNIRGAIQSCQKAIQLDPKSIDGYNNLGVLFQKVGQHKNALSSFMRALKLAPWNPLIYGNIGDAYSSLSDLDKAQEYYQKALQINPKQPHIAKKLKAIAEKRA